MSKEILGLFPSFGRGLTGGIEASGELAWEAITQFSIQHDRKVRALLYGKAPANAADLTNVQIATSKSSALLKSATVRACPSVILVWHLGLLKLLPPLLRFRPHIALYLHGIEAWRTQDMITRLLLRRVDVFLSNSEFTWDRFLEYQPQLATRRHQVIHLGTGSPDETQPKPEPDARPMMLMVSRVSQREDYKGHRELISVWPAVLRLIPGARLVIAGEGDLRPVLEHLVELNGLSGSVQILGYVSERAKLELLLQCRCLAMPSRNEGFGLVYLEAMRVGRPCLVSTVDAGREVVNPPEAGLAADLQDNQSLVDSITRLLTPGTEWDRWSQAARARYVQHFTFAAFRSRLNSYLVDVLR